MKSAKQNFETDFLFFFTGPSSIALLQKDVLDYLFANLVSINQVNEIIGSSNTT